MRVLADSHWLTPTFVFAVQLVMFLRWLHRRIRNDEITRIFVQDIAVNHLPHIYEVLQRLCNEQGIEGRNPPVVQWLNINSPEN